MSINLGPELENRVREAATRTGQDIEGFVRRTLVRELDSVERSLRRREREDSLRLEYEAAMLDPLFVQDMEETMTAFAHVDGETARMIDDD